MPLISLDDTALHDPQWTTADQWLTPLWGEGALTCGAARVWLATPVPEPPTGPSRLLGLLSPEELSTRAALRRDTDRDLYTAAHALARLAVAQVQRSTPNQDDVVAAAHRRPYLPGHPDLDLSLSHTDGLVAVAIARHARVGVDVESIHCRPLLIPSVLSGREREAIADAPELAGAAFSRYWTLKEAISKASGQGLQLPFGRLELSQLGSPPQLLAGHDVIDLPDRGWALAHRAIGLPQRWSLAVAVHAVHPERRSSAMAAALSDGNATRA